VDEDATTVDNIGDIEKVKAANFCVYSNLQAPVV